MAKLFGIGQHPVAGTASQASQLPVMGPMFWSVSGGTGSKQPSSSTIKETPYGANLSAWFAKPCYHLTGILRPSRQDPLAANILLAACSIYLLPGPRSLARDTGPVYSLLYFGQNTGLIPPAIILPAAISATLIVITVVRSKNWAKKNPGAKTESPKTSHQVDSEAS